MTNGKNITAYIKPLNIVLDLGIISLLGFYCFKHLVAHSFHFWLYQFSFWGLIAYFSGYYEVYRFTRPLTVFKRIALQFIIFTTAIVAFFVFSEHTALNGPATVKFIGLVLLATTFHKVVVMFYFRKLPHKNSTNALIIGNTVLLPQEERQGVLASFAQAPGQNAVDLALTYAQTHNTDTIYCALNQVKPSHIDKLKTYCFATGTALRFIPDENVPLPKGVEMDYYKEYPLFCAKKSPMDNPAALSLKRVFDLVFTLLVMVFVFSWLVPIVALFIKLESKGPVFFKQIRVGYNGKEFMCWKFRSMKVNNSEGKLTVKNDPRITKVGAFLRKTSIDEMPQFINVLLGNMSVVGPRPKIWSHHNQYKDHIHKFMDRINVKPGITGMAQVSGYRGEINSDAEMQNRIRYDVFYIENWSMLLDIRIIIQTVVNIFMGEEKAF